MDVFGLRDSLIGEYSEYMQSFLRPAHPAARGYEHGIRRAVAEAADPAQPVVRTG
jgi:hypothetical protein